MAPALRRFLVSKAFIFFLYRFIRAYASTFRLRVINEQPWQHHIVAGGRVLLCSWHQQFFSFITYFETFRPYRPSLMISQSRDGSMIAGVARLSGWQAVRGSSSRDGHHALVEMIVNLRHGRLAAHILDGPRGPAGVVKRGAIDLAVATGAVIVPVYAEAGARWVFNSWDRFFIPKPFSRVTIRFGDAIPMVADRDDAGGRESQRLSLERLMRPALV